MSVFARAMSLGAILIMLAAYTAPAKAQEQPQAVHGIIFDSEGNPLVGATVVVAGGVQGTTTDTKGKFTLKVKPSDSLTFSYLGYTSQTTKVGSRTKFNIRLEKDASTDIEEVVVIGYGQVAKKDLTGSVSTVKMNDIKDLPTLSVDNALQGRIAGADFMSTTGEPGRLRFARYVRRHPHHHQTGTRHDGQAEHHVQDRHRLLAAAPPPRHHERGGIRTIPQRLRLVRLRRQPSRHRRRYAALRLGVPRPALAGRGNRLDQGDHPHGHLLVLRARSRAPTRKPRTTLRSPTTIRRASSTTAARSASRGVSTSNASCSNG